MRLFFLIALAGMILSPLSLSASADEAVQIGHATSLKRFVVPNPQMLLRTGDGRSPTRGAEIRGHQLVDPARIGGGPHANPAAQAAARIKTDGSRMAASDAADTVKARDQ